MNRLRELRKAKSLTSLQLGEILGLSDSSVRFIERGERGFSMESLKRACDYFGVSADYLLGADPQSMLNDFVGSIKRDFYQTIIHRDCDVTEIVDLSIPSPLRIKIQAIVALAEIKTPAALSRIMECIKLCQAQEDFKGE